MKSKANKGFPEIVAVDKPLIRLYNNCDLERNKSGKDIHMDFLSDFDSEKKRY